jgi:hypothetical protein
MGLRVIAGLAALSATMVLGGWSVASHFTVPSADLEAFAASIELPPEPAATPDRKQDRAPSRPIAAAAIIDTSLFDPRPWGPTNQPASQPVQMASLTVEPARVAAPEHTAAVSRSPVPVPEPRKLVVPKVDKESGLTPAHIAQIRHNLRLTPDQERHWQPIEAELRELAKQMAAQKQQGRKPALSADAAQRLYWTAGPFIMSLRDDQKQEARRLARAMGLEQVAALL